MNNIIISGSGGFIGNNLINHLKNYNVIRVKKNFLENKIYFLNQKNKTIELSDLAEKEILYIHLATYFSKENTEQKNIYEANVDYGINILKLLNKLELKKIIYTNSMYAFYPDQDIRDLDYTKSKIIFSEYVDKYCKDKEILFNEIFLDNTYGINDPRKKVIPLILKSVIENSKNPISNPNNFINLIHVKDVVNHICEIIDKPISSSNLYLHPKSINLQSIYKHLSENSKFQDVFKDYLEYSDNDYIESNKINLFEIHNSIETSKGLLKLLRNEN